MFRMIIMTISMMMIFTIRIMMVRMIIMTISMMIIFTIKIMILAHGSSRYNKKYRIRDENTKKSPYEQKQKEKQKQTEKQKQK